jgi:hypothetical protein
MLLRAVFWIAVVSFFMPREPDLGYGRPSDGGIAGLIHTAQAAAGESQAACTDAAGACAKSLSILDAFQGVAVNNLADVKADIEQSRHARFEQLAARD